MEQGRGTRDIILQHANTCTCTCSFMCTYIHTIKAIHTGIDVPHPIMEYSGEVLYGTIHYM